MPPRLDVVGLVVKDMSTSLEFYRRLGFTFADGADAEGHVETALPGGPRFILDTAEIVQGFDPDWAPPSGDHRIALAFACDSPAEVDGLHRDLVAAGYESHLEPWDAFWGQRYASRPGWFAPTTGLGRRHPGGPKATTSVSRTWAEGCSCRLRSVDFTTNASRQRW